MNDNILLGNLFGSTLTEYPTINFQHYECYFDSFFFRLHLRRLIKQSASACCCGFLSVSLPILVVSVRVKKGKAV